MGIRFVKMPLELEESPAWHGMNIAVLTQLYYSANWKAGYFRGHEVKPFQVATSYSSIADKVGISRRTAITVLKNLEDAGLITKTCIDNKFTIVTLLVRAEIGGEVSGEASGEVSGANISPLNSNGGEVSGEASGASDAHNSRYKIIDNKNTDSTDAGASSGGEPKSADSGKSKPKKEKPENEIIPPSLEMVAKYCKERGNGIKAEEFIDFYESKGWKVGKNRMKDWQCAVRTWEHSRGFKYKKPEELLNANQPSLFKETRPEPYPGYWEDMERLKNLPVLEPLGGEHV